MKTNTLHILALCGVVGPLLFTLVLLVLGILAAPYNHVAQYMSELGATGVPYAIVMNAAGFIMLGCCIILSALGLHQGINSSNKSKIGPTLLMFSGIGFIMTGFLPCDPGCVTVSIIGILHGYAALLAQMALILALLPFAFRVKNVKGWENYDLFSLVMFLLSLLLAGLYKSFLFEGTIGLLQRLSFGVPLAWLEIVMINLFRQTTPHHMENNAVNTATT
jgi:hypothetical membrane protein